MLPSYMDLERKAKVWLGLGNDLILLPCSSCYPWGLTKIHPDTVDFKVTWGGGAREVAHWLCALSALVEDPG